MTSLTAIIITKNEEKNIRACIESIQNLAERIVVVDSGSTDNTVLIAREMGADVYKNDFHYYAQQFNWGIDNTGINTKWILRLDADERFTPELCIEAEKLMIEHQDDEVNGIVMEAVLFFLGRPMLHGIKNKRKMMLFKTGIGRIEDRKRDAYSIINEGYTVECNNKFLHYDFKDINNFINKYNWYATREVVDYIEYVEGKNQTVNSGDLYMISRRKKKYGGYYKAPMFVRCWLWFLYNYIFKLGFLDGKEGLVFLFLECYWYRMVVDSKLYEYKKTGIKPEELCSL